MSHTRPYWLLLPILGLTACNSAPNISGDVISAESGQQTTIDVLANDTDPDADPLLLKRVWGASKGEVAITADNTVTYTPTPGASGTDEFWYRAKDNRGHAKTGKVTVSIVPAGPGREASVTVTAPAASSVTVQTNPSPTPTTVESSSPSNSNVVATPPSPPLGTTMIRSVTVRLHTTEDDKNREDPVRIIVRRGDEVVADKTFGAGELWGANSDRSFDLPLKPEVPITDAGLLNLDVKKPPAGAIPAASWTARVEADGSLSDGRKVTLLPQTQSVKFGDSERSDRTWAMQAPK